MALKIGKRFSSQAPTNNQLLGLGLQQHAVETEAAFHLCTHGKVKHSGAEVLPQPFVHLAQPLHTPSSLPQTLTDEGQFVTHPPTLSRNKVIKPDLSADRKPADIFNSAY